MKQLLLACGFVLIAATSFCQTTRIVGYLPTYRFSSSSQIEYCRLTHLNLAFANLNSAGNIVMQDISSVVSDALNDNPDIIICISIAVAGLTAEQTKDWSNLIDISSNRPAFIAKIVDYVLLNNLDGVDVDLEWEHVTSGYSGFVTELDSALDRHNKIITAAFPNQTLFSTISDDALYAFTYASMVALDVSYADIDNVGTAYYNGRPTIEAKVNLTTSL